MGQRAKGKKREKLMKKKIIGLALGAMLFALSYSASAQQTGKISRIGFLDRSTASGNEVLLKVFRQELGKLGWVEGKNIASSTGLPIKNPNV